MNDLVVLLHVTSKCKQDYSNWIFFKVLDSTQSMHFPTIANDYFRLFLVDMHAVLCRSKARGVTFWKVFNRLGKGEYEDNDISTEDTIRWHRLLSGSYSTIEKVIGLRDKQVDHIQNGSHSPYLINNNELKQMLVKMEQITLEMCRILGISLDSILTVEEQSNHSIAEAFKRI
jgi:hypothetical protein